MGSRLLLAFLGAFLLLLALPDHIFAAQRAVLFLEHEENAPWTELLRKGLEKGGKDFDFVTEVIAVPHGSEQEAAFRKAAEYADLILVATDNFHEILRDNAANFRRVKFGCLDAGIRAPNIMSVTFADEEAAFLAGMAAAMFTQRENAGSNARQITVGWLSGMDTPAMRSLVNGFAEGAKLVDPQTTVAQAVVASFVDGEMAAEKAGWIVKQHPGLVALAAGAGNIGAISVLDASNVWHIALDGYSGAKNPFGLIAKRTDQAVYEIMRSAASPKFGGKQILVYNLANSGVGFFLSDNYLQGAFDGKSEIQRRLRELRKEIIDGSIKIPSLRARTLCDCLD